MKDLRAKNYLFQAIDKNILKTMAEKGSAKQLWNSMKTKFQGNDRVKRAQLNILKREFEILEMKVGESVTDYIGRVMSVANNMWSLGKVMTDVKIVEKVLRTLNEKFNYNMCSIEESKDTSKLSIDELQSSLLLHEQNFKIKKTDEQLLKTGDEGYSPDGRGNFRGISIFGYRGRGNFRGRGPGRGFVPRSSIKCHKCHKMEHYQNECPDLYKEVLSL